MTEEKLTARRDVGLFLRSGVVWAMCSDAYWLLLFIRVVSDLRLHPAQLLLLGTAKEISILVSEVPTGVVADVVSRKRSIWIAFMMSGTGIMLAGLAPGFWWMVVAQLVWGCGSTFRSGAETAWITDELVGDAAHPIDDRRLAQLFVTRGQWVLVGGLTGVASAGLLSLVVSLGTALVVVGATLAAWGLWLIAAMPEHHFSPVAGSGRERYLSTWRDARAVLRVAAPLRWQLWAIVVAGCASEAVDRLYVRRLFEIGLPARTSEVLVIGSLGVAEALVGVALARAVRHRIGGARTAFVAVALLVLTAGGVAVVGVASLLGIAAVGFVLQGGVRQATATAQVVWTNSFATSASRATVHSFAGQAQSLGEISGGALFGVVVSQSSLSTAFVGSAGLYLAAGALALIGARAWATSAVRSGAPPGAPGRLPQAER